MIVSHVIELGSVWTHVVNKDAKETKVRPGEKITDQKKNWSQNYGLISVRLGKSDELTLETPVEADFQQLANYDVFINFAN